jgi:hypothetical protein
MDRSRRNRLLRFALLNAFWMLLVGVAVLAYRGGGVDFRAYYAASLVVRRGGNPYDYTQLAPVIESLVGTAGGTPYFYPPWFCVATLPLTFFPYPVARAIWLGLNAGLFFVGLELMRRALRHPLIGWRRWLAYIVVTLSLAAYCLRSEQVGILLMFGLALALWAVKFDRPWLTGLGMVIALTKPQVTLLPLCALGVWLLLNKPRAVVWGVGWGLAFTAVATLVIPRWWDFDLASSSRAISMSLEGPDQVMGLRVNTTLYHLLFFGWGVTPPLTYVIVTGVGIAVAGLAFSVRRQFHDPVMLTATAVLVNLLFTPYTLQYDYPLLVIPLWWLLPRWGSRPAGLRWGGLAVLLLSASVITWQTWSYQAYWMLVGVTAVFFAVALSRQRDRAEDV